MLPEVPVKLPPMCDTCPRDAEAAITLGNGEYFQVCRECVEAAIREHASTENPVHSIEELEA